MSPALILTVPALVAVTEPLPVAVASMVAPGVCGIEVLGILRLKGRVLPLDLMVPSTEVPKVAAVAVWVWLRCTTRVIVRLLV